METAITRAIIFFRPNLMSRSKKPVKTSRMTKKMPMFATDVGSSNAVMPASCTGSESARAPISTRISNRGMARNGMSRLKSMRCLQLSLA